MDADLIFKIILVVAIFTVSLVVAMYSTYAERKVAAQDRIGPNRAGVFGLLQPLADGVKMFMKEEIIPNVSNKFLFVLGPCLAMMTALMAGVLIPWGGNLIIGDHTYSLQIADLNIGMLYIFGVTSLGVYGIMIGGWASNSLFGAIRASAQMVSYEVAMGLAIIALNHWYYEFGRNCKSTRFRLCQYCLSTFRFSNLFDMFICRIK